MKSEFSIKLSDKTIKARKWKVKDRNKFVSGDASDISRIQEALVYDCLLTNSIALSDEEYKFVLCKIREQSIKTPIMYTFDCTQCKEEFEYIAVLSDIIKPKYKKYEPIKNGTHSFCMGPIRNRVFYTEKLQSVSSESEREYIDFLLHIQAYNNNDALTFDDLVDCINELDVDVFEQIFNEWNSMKFRIDCTHSVQCPHCKYSEMYEFDDLPNFFPDSWSI